MKGLTAIDLFAGAGGLSCGLVSEGFNIAAAVEVDPTSAKSYMMNHKAVNVLIDDIRHLSGPYILEKANIRRKELDLLTGCPPCQGFSTLRTKRKAISEVDARNDLIKEVLRLTRSMRPRTVVIENVPNLAADNRFAEFRKGLQKAGYKSEYAVVNASNFGVPQRRKRLVLIAFRDKEIPLNWSTYHHHPATVRDAIGQLETAGHSGDHLHDIPEQRTDAVMKRIRATPKNGGSRKDIPHELQCACHMKRSSGFFDVYGRMAWDSVSPTITSGCSNPSKGRFLHPEEDRAITLREAALLQTFPPDYKFCLDRGKDHVARQIGNAFPPKLIRPIAKVIKQVLSTT
ncbi:MAG: DNA cytosine methyltransferase [Phormidesmis sp.]